ncbi:acyltransferase family protein [Hymenobacter actinosclerus]|uniref:Peptidoglycan/LPS O-acetylase OafA/YrhL, contains acyltransferase and SGNH-hydrolase domains n=1 Tax=Hymenobacter actinosclerus TaxID=82805 RepID=A0A1I0F1X4_9BACT|nr:acyltransferase [Hymenobacter actinosclerus]SET52004.1 Peptidoglycan/LPS O-acetylase OafA/YrhL, contains acyltransferase and SGNH-hydrolase domains [Hymenobacter actinosclerus]
MRRITYLDSVRGLAAFAVLVYHFIGWRWAETLEYKLGAMLFNGSDAVSLFFVLSGLVLSWKYFHPDESAPITGETYRAYIVNRIVRLYVPFLAALSIYYLYNHRHEPLGLIASDLFTNTHHWVEEALLIRGKHDNYIPAWTLEAEMAGSVFVPFLVLLLRYSRQLFVALMLGILVLGSAFVFGIIQHFCLGMLLAYFFKKIEAYDTRQTWWYRYRFGLYALVLVLFSIRHITRIFPIGEIGNYWLGLLRLDLFHITGVASFLMLAYLINSPRLQHFFTSRVFLFLGRISYSLYLVHWFFVVYVMEHWDKLAEKLGTNPTQTFWILLAGTVTATLAGATAFNILIERPAIRWGRRVSDRFTPVSVSVPHASLQQ